MTIRISLTHHDADAPEHLRADIHSVSLEGEVSEFPRQTHEIAPGMTHVMHLHRGNVLVLRELHRTGDANAYDCEDAT